MLRKSVRFLIGAAAGLALWWFGTPAYNRTLARAAESLLRMDSRLRNSFVAADGRSVSISGADLPRIQIPADQLTYNVVLLCGLFATLPVRRRRTSIAFGLSCAIIALGHLFGLVTSAEATFAARLASWSNARYTAREQDVWTAMEYVYRLAGMFGIAFACWWGASSEGRQPS